MNKKDKVEIQLQLAERDRQIAELKAENKELRSWYNEGTASNSLKADAIREMLAEMKNWSGAISQDAIRRYADNLEGGE